MSQYYTLNEHGEPVADPDLTAWGKWMEAADRRVARDTIVDDDQAVVVSTVFLGLDHNFDGGPPVLWETMVFGGPMDQHMDRCAGSREQAEAMHATMMQAVKAALASTS